MTRQRGFHRLAAALIAAPLLLAAAPPAELESAIAAQRVLIEERPGDGGVFNDLGNLLVEARRLEAAEEAYRRAMELEPERPEAPYNLALLMRAVNRPREARRLLRAMLEQHPDHAWGHYLMGTLRQARGDRSGALKSFRGAFRLDPSLSDPRRNPHVLDNSLATAAMLEAFDMIAPEAVSQRIYVEPARISGLLLPPLTAEPAAEVEPPAEAEPPAEGEPPAEAGAPAAETEAESGDGG